MHSLRNPQWVFWTSTIPVVLYMAICAGEFSVVHTLLPAESLTQWWLFGLALGLLAIAGGGYAGLQLARRLALGPWYSVAAVLAYSAWLCLLTTQDVALIPRSIPRWMVPTDLVLMAWTFLMPTLAHAMLSLVLRFTPDDQRLNAGLNFGLALLLPIGWGLVFQVLAVVPHWFGWTSVANALLVPSMVLSTLSFFFFLTRGMVIITQRKERNWADGSLVWKILITTGLPVLGLLLNSGLLLGQFLGTEGIFGNFSSPWFYGLAVLNGVLLCVPDSEQPGVRLAQLLGRSVLFGYTFYFFLVFLPFLPLAIPAIILLGLGLLLLAPLLLFVVHVRQLSFDVAALRTVYSPRLVTAVLVAGLATLPLVITGSFWQRRQVLHEALAYVYTPNYAAPKPVDADALVATLAQIRHNKDRGWGVFSGSQQPYLSTYFNWLVLDNLMLSEEKMSYLELIFTGAQPQPDYVRDVWNGDPPPPPRVRRTDAPDLGLRDQPRADPSAPQLRNATASSTYDARQQAWVSWVSLEIANVNPSFQNREYSTAIALPAGCWVSDYYLTIGGRQERGILAEKKAATWVFAQILSENSSRDPGLLSYRGPNDIAVRVYPVSGGEVRRTRIQFLHKEPCVLTVDGRPLALGDSTTAAPVAAPVAVPGSGVAYLSSAAKQRLPLVRRRPYYHFLLDASANQEMPAQLFRDRISQQLAHALPHGAPARFSLVNAATTLVPADADWAEALGRTRLAGGYYLGGAIRRVLFEAQEHPTDTYPVLVAVTDNLQNIILDADFEDFRSAYPESDAFYVLGADGRLVAHSLRRTSRWPMSEADTARAGAPGAVRPVRAWPTAAHPQAYLPNTPEAAVVVAGRPAVPATGGTAAPASRWLAGLLLRGYGQWQSFHPETTDAERVPFIQASFRAGILTPFTSFLALENEAQKAALQRKQEQTLAANASLDTMENQNSNPTATPIDSGALLLLVAGGLLAAWHLRRRRLAAV